MRYKVGDKVKIREDLRQTTYGGFFVTQEMLELKGKEVTITEINKSGFSGRYGYRVDMGDSRCHWSEEMFKPVNSEVDDNKQVRTVDVGFTLEHCGNRVIENVWQGGWASECKEKSVFFTTYDCKNQYTLPLTAINWIIPHEED